MSMRTFAIFIFCFFTVGTARAEEGDPDLRMPLVEEALQFLKTQALADVPESVYLRAGARRVCGLELDGAGCRPTGAQVPAAGDRGTAAIRAWRRILESAMSAAIAREQRDFDRVAFERYVVDGMVEALDDPASFFLVPSVYRKINSIPADFVGFGFRVLPVEDALLIGAVHAGSPARKAGLSPGDRIVEVEDQPVTGYHRPLALAAIWGADGNTLRLCVSGSRGGSRDVKLVYTPWTFRSYDIERKKEVVVVRVRHFERGLVAALKKELERPAKGLVIDLGEAASGDEDEAAALADLLLAKGSIGSKTTRTDLGSREWTATPGSDGEQLQLATSVVVDGGTGGIAELLAAALRHPARALLVGRPTAGRDTLETLRPFKDGSAIQVTSMRLLGPNGASLADGVQPHVKTARADLAALAVSILQKTEGPSMEQLLEAARAIVK